MRSNLIISLDASFVSTVEGSGIYPVILQSKRRSYSTVSEAGTLHVPYGRSCGDTEIALLNHCSIISPTKGDTVLLRTLRRGLFGCRDPEENRDLDPAVDKSLPSNNQT